MPLSGSFGAHLAFFTVPINLKVKLDFELTCYKEAGAGSIYTVKFEDHDTSELERFLTDEEHRAQWDFEPLSAKLQRLAEKTGFEPHFFRNESDSDNSVCALSYDADENRQGDLRLYCCRWTEGICIAGYGGVKTTRTYQEDPKLDEAVRRMEYVDRRLYDRLLSRGINVGNRHLYGNLTFRKTDLA